MGPAQQRLAGHVRPGLLRHRDDVGRRGRLRHQPPRHGGLPGLAPPGRPHDRGRPGLPEDGPGPAPGLRPDDGAQVGHLHGRLRLDRAACSTTTPSSRASTRSCRSTSTPRAARPRPRRCCTPSSPCTRRSGPARSPAARAAAVPAGEQATGGWVPDRARRRAGGHAAVSDASPTRRRRHAACRPARGAAAARPLGRPAGLPAPGPLPRDGRRPSGTPASRPAPTSARSTT